MRITVHYKGLNRVDTIDTDTRLTQTQIENFLQLRYNVDFNAFTILDITRESADVEYDFTYTFAGMPECVEDISFD